MMTPTDLITGATTVVLMGAAVVVVVAVAVPVAVLTVILDLSVRKRPTSAVWLWDDAD